MERAHRDDRVIATQQRQIDHFSRVFYQHFALEDTKEIVLFGPYLKENPGGFSIGFVCDDRSVKGRSWYWDQT